MTDIREAREVGARALEDDDSWIGSDEIGPVIDCDKASSIVIAALSEAGMTICGEQVGWQYPLDDSGAYRLYLGPQMQSGDVPVFVPLSDPQEGDK